MQLSDQQRCHVLLHGYSDSPRLLHAALWTRGLTVWTTSRRGELARPVCGASALCHGYTRIPKGQRVHNGVGAEENNEVWVLTCA